jgi:hypothetical protein
MSVENRENFYNEERPEPKPETRPEQPQERIELSNKEILGIFSSERFLEVIKKAGRETKRSGHETDFDVSIFENKSFLIPKIRRGMTDNMQESKIIEGRPLDAKDNLKNHSNIGFHFHPTESTAIMPSEADLYQLSSDSLFGVCQIEKDNTIDILLVKLKNNVHVSEIGDNANGYIDEVSDSEDFDEGDMPKSGQSFVSQALDNNGFESFLISFQYNKGEYTITNESEKIISKIGNLKLKLRV